MGKPVIFIGSSGGSTYGVIAMASRALNSVGLCSSLNSLWDGVRFCHSYGDVLSRVREYVDVVVVDCVV